MGFLDNVRQLRLLLAVRSRFREASKMGKLKTVLFAVGAAVSTAVVAQITGACPELLSAAPTIITAVVGGIATYLMRKPLSNPGVKAAATGIGGFVVATLAQQLDLVCGVGFVKKLPALAMAGVWVGLGLWLKAPHENPGVFVTPPGPEVKG